MSPVIIKKNVRLVASAERLWTLMSDTPRLNAFIGAGALDVEATDGRDGARFVLKTKVSGFPLEYRELPFEWVENRTFSFRRLMIGGLVGELRVRYDFAPRDDGGTTLGIELSAEPRSVLLWPLVKIVVARNARGIVRYARAVDTHLGTVHVSVFPPPTIDRAALENARVAQLNVLDQASKELVQLLADTAGVLTPAQRKALAEKLAAHLGAAQG